MMKMNGIVQWIKCNRNNRFVNLPSLPWQPEISGAVHLVLPGRQAGQSGRAGQEGQGRKAGQADREYLWADDHEMQVNFKNFLYIETANFLLRLTKVQHRYSCTNAFQVVFLEKCIARLFFKV